jgi:hypothetical protein
MMITLKEVAQEKVLKKIRKRRQQVIRTYEKVVLKLEAQLEKVNRINDQEAVATLREIIQSGLDQSRTLLERAQQDYNSVVAKQAETWNHKHLS